jgi:hypothetical protein
LRHDWASHGADTKRMMACAYRELLPPPPPKPKEPMRGIGQITVDEFLRLAQPIKPYV